MSWAKARREDNALSPIGILGGTFDPIHFGHLRLAQELAVNLGISEIRFIPAGRPPHRSAPGASAQQRLEMVRRAIAGNPLFRLDAREILRPRPSYTVDTLQELREELGEAKSLCLFVGADAFLGLATWHRWQELFRLAHIVVAHRPGFPLPGWSNDMPDLLAQELEQRLQTDPHRLHSSPHGFVLYQTITALDISASCIRSNLRNGISPRYLLPDTVLDHIQSSRLYTREANGN